MLPANRGKLNVFGQRLDKMTNSKRDGIRANNVGYVFQQFNLIPYLNAIDNIQLANYLSKQTPQP
jgi:putative ABC transport system ATP-binding protein